MNHRYLILTTAAIALLGFATTLRPAVRLVFNPSESAPRGFYFTAPVAALRRGDLVLVTLPSDVAKLAADRGYLPRSVPALKRIAAMPGQSVCARDSGIYISGDRVAETLAVDGKRRELRAWNGCRELLEGELFLLNPSAKSSFDSRYFGPLDRSFVRARAVPLWTW